MHFFIDENLSLNLAKALHYFAQLRDEGHSVVHAKIYNGRVGVPDNEWLESLKAEGHWIIISKDRFNKGDPERLAFENAGLSIINLGKEWKRKNGWETAFQLVKWWPTISRDVLKFNGPMLVELPWGAQEKLRGRPLKKKA